MSKIITSVGPKNAKIFIVGDCMGIHEEIEDKPFAGSSGNLLTNLLMRVGLIREECRLGNLIQHTDINLTQLYIDKQCRLPSELLLDNASRLKREIVEYNPNIVMALGNDSLFALTGNRGVKNWRGSVTFEKSLGCKVISTFHPRELMKAWDNMPLALFDFKRLRKESEFKEYVLKHREFIIEPTFEQVILYLSGVRGKLAFDVETDEDNHITAFAIAKSPWDVISIPFTVGNGIPYWTEEEEESIWKQLKILLENKGVGKIAQNAQFDILISSINPYHIKVTNLILDTMCAFHTVYPEIASAEKMKWDEEAKSRISTGGGKTLAIISSIYTDQPYYKHWGHTGNDKMFWKYNAMDASVTFEAADEIEKEMKEFNVYEFYHKFVNPLIPILIRTQLRGVRVDEDRRLELLSKYEKEYVKLQEKLNNVLGRNVNVNSSKQLGEILYEDMKLPPVYNRKTRKVTTDERALQSLSDKYPSPIFDLILRIRHDRKLISTYLQDKGGDDGRVRCSYVIGGTETGRLSSRKSVFGTGTNLQNVPPGECRSMFIPDENKIFVHPDLSQAEARVVAYLAEEVRLIELFNSGKDVHKENASMIFNKPVNEVNEEERNLAKKLVHASNYGIGVKTFSYHAKIDFASAKDLLNKYFNLYPNIKRWQLQVQADLGKSRIMTTPLGRRRRFFGRWSDDLFREAYAFVPQSTISDLLNLAIIKMNDKLGDKFELMLQEHDAFTIQIPTESNSYEWVKYIMEAFNTPLNIKGRVLHIPVDIKTGCNWGEMVAYEK